MVHIVDVAPSHVARRRWLAFAVAGIVSIGYVAAGFANTKRVVLAGLPDNLADATATALVPWRIELVRVAETPAADETLAQHEVAPIAERARAGAVVWLAPPGAPPTLWLYDASSRQLLSRPLPSAPPYDDPTAASVALSIKTLLRHSSVAPPAERVAPPPPLAASPPGPKPYTPEPKPYTAEAHTTLRLSRNRATSWHAEPRLGLGVTWWPGFVPGRHGLGLHIDLGTGQHVQRAGFRGRLSDVAPLLSAHRDVSLPWLDGRLSAIPMLGVGVQITRLSGEQQPQSQPVQTSRIVPHLAAGVDVYARIGRITRVGVALRVARMLRTDDYESMDRTVVSAPVFQINAGVALLVSL